MAVLYGERPVIYERGCPMLCEVIKVSSLVTKPTQSKPENSVLHSKYAEDHRETQADVRH